MDPAFMLGHLDPANKFAMGGPEYGLCHRTSQGWEVPSKVIVC